jgi:hypothetical protein
MLPRFAGDGKIAARVLKPAGFSMTARIVVPVVPNLMDEAFTRAPALRHPGTMTWPAIRALLSPFTAPRSQLASWIPSASRSDSIQHYAHGSMPRRPLETAEVPKSGSNISCHTISSMSGNEV